MKRFIVCALIGIISSSVFAQSTAQNIAKGIEFHNAAKTESDGYARKCKESLFPYIDVNMTARAYYGSAVTLEAGYCSKSNPLHALDLLREGSSYIDEAVAKENTNAELHIIRLVNGILVSKSSPFKRYAVIKDDVAYLLEKKNTAALDKNTMALIYLYCGYFRIEENSLEEAFDLFDKAIAAAPGSDSAKEAQIMEARYEE